MPRMRGDPQNPRAFKPAPSHITDVDFNAAKQTLLTYQTER